MMVRYNEKAFFSVFFFIVYHQFIDSYLINGGIRELMLIILVLKCFSFLFPVILQKRKKNVDMP